MASSWRLFALLTGASVLLGGILPASAQGFDIFRKPQAAPAQPAAPAKGQRPAAAPAAPRSGGLFPTPPPARTQSRAVPSGTRQPQMQPGASQQAAPSPGRRPVATPPSQAAAQPVQPASAPPNPFRLFDFFRGPTQRPDRPSGWPFGQQSPVEVVKPQQIAPSAPQPAPQTARPAAPRPVKPAVEVTAWIMILGDSIGDNLAAGLGDALADRPEISVKRRIRPALGLTDTGETDWPKVAAEVADADKLTYVVIELGSRDNVPMIDGDREIAVLSPEWKERYAARVDAVLEPFKAKGTKVFWVGAPPMRDADLSADLVAINDIIKERVGIAGQTYIDVWEGFVNESDAYAQTGPDLEGREVRLRLNDGMHFTRAGSRKLAHYVERDIRRDIDEGGKPQLPTADVPPIGAEQPDAGPLIVLTAPVLAPNGQLVGDAAASKPSEEIERILVRGEEMAPLAGRMDDASWRPPGSLPVVAIAAAPFGPPADPQGPLLAGASPTATAYSTSTPSETGAPATSPLPVAAEPTVSQ